MSSWRDIRNYQRTAQIAQAAERFRKEQEAERQKSPADVFVSYSSRDRQEARLLCTKLEKAGIAYFLDEKDIKAGDELPPTLEREIRKRKFYLLLLSKYSAASQWVTYEWALAKGAGCDVRILCVGSDVDIPTPLSSIVAGDDLDQEVLYYANKKYDRLSLQVLLRDLLRPLTMDMVVKFRPVPGRSSVWEHPDAASWPEKDRDKAWKRQFDLVKDPSPRIARIEVRLNDTPPKLVLHCKVEQPFELVIAPKGEHLELTSWWDRRENRTVIVHPAFWSAALEELVSLLEGKKTLLTRHGREVNDLFPVTWA